MSDDHLKVKFEGYDADRHLIEMRQFGRSLQGLDRIVNIGLVGAQELRPPRRRERSSFTLRVRAPSAGSFELITQAGIVAGILPIVHDVFVSGLSEYLWRWVNWVISMKANREDQATQQVREVIAAMERMNQAYLGRASETEARILKDKSETEERTFALVHELLHKVGPSARDLVEPIGSTCRSMEISGRRIEHRTEIDVPTADIIRMEEDVEIGESQNIRIHVDGLIHHTRTLKIHNPENPGKFINATVVDPAFSIVPNVYTQAIINRGWIEVTAKPAYKAGRLHMLYISDAKQIS